MTPRWVVYDEPAGGGGGGPWDPSQLSSTSIWVDIDSLGLSNGSGITTLTDRTGNGYDLADPNGGSDHATVVSGDLNGLDVAQFNDLGGYRILDWPGPFGNDGMVVAAVVDIATPSTTALIADLRESNQQLITPAMLTNGSLSAGNNRRDSTDSDNVDLVITSATTGWGIVVVSHDYVTGNVDLRLNGVSGDTGTLNSTGPGPETNIDVAVGSSVSNTAPWESKLAEVLFFDDRLTTGATGDLERVEGYLAHRYALQSKLPVSHPYKNAAP